MFGIGFTELIVIFIVALLVLGPKRLPEVAKTLGKFYRDIKSTVDEVKTAVVDDTVKTLPKEEDIIPKNLEDLEEKKIEKKDVKKTELKHEREKITFKKKNTEENLNDAGSEKS